jgi:hypothetical protein
MSIESRLSEYYQKIARSVSELMDYFVYKYIGKKYLNSNRWGKMEEIKMYDETSSRAQTAHLRGSFHSSA